MFLTLTGRPLRSIARRFGAPPSIPSVALFLGVFAASAIQHGYLYTYLPTYKERETSRAYVPGLPLFPRPPTHITKLTCPFGPSATSSSSPINPS